MVFPRMRAAVFAVLFALWIGILANLAFESQGRVIVAGPQIQRSKLIVLAKLTDIDGRAATTVHIDKVLHAEKVEWRAVEGQTLELPELIFFTGYEGWAGAGVYVLPLNRYDAGKPVVDRVTPLPLSPGYLPILTTATIATGTTPEKVADVVANWTEAPRGRLRERIAKPGEVDIVNLPVRLYSTRFTEFEKAIAAAGGTVTSAKPAESRIYPASDDVLNQVATILKLR